MHSGVNEGVEALLYLASGEYDGAYLGHAVRARVKAGGLNIKGHHLVVHVPVTAAVNRKASVKVVYKVALAAVDYFHAVLFSGLPHIGECLEHTVVGDGYRRMPPVCRPLYDGRGIGQRVKRGKAGVYMQLHALFPGIVGSDIFFA